METPEEKVADLWAYMKENYNKTPDYKVMEKYIELYGQSPFDVAVLTLTEFGLHQSRCATILLGDRPVAVCGPEDSSMDTAEKLAASRDFEMVVREVHPDLAFSRMRVAAMSSEDINWPLHLRGLCDKDPDRNAISENPNPLVDRLNLPDMHFVLLGEDLLTRIGVSDLRSSNELAELLIESPEHRQAEADDLMGTPGSSSAAPAP